MAELSHEDLVAALLYGWPGVEWSYDGDGSSLDPVYGEQPVDENGDPVGDPPLLSRGLEWHDQSKRPTLAQIIVQVPAGNLARERAGKLAEISVAYQAAQVAALSPKGKDYLEKLQQLYADAQSSNDPASITIPPAPKA